MSTNLSKTRSLWSNVLNIIECEQCKQRRRKIRKFIKGEHSAVVMFSGGLDSTYTALELSKNYNVTLYHIKWEYLKKDSGYASEYNAATKIASTLDLTLDILATMKIESVHCGHIMRVPIIGMMSICHRSMNFDVLGTGLTPSTSDRDAQWCELLQVFANQCMPNLEIVHPRDGISREDQWKVISDEIKPLIVSCFGGPNGTRCGKCNKCKEDEKWLKRI